MARDFSDILSPDVTDSTIKKVPSKPHTREALEFEYVRMMDTIESLKNEREQLVFELKQERERCVHLVQENQQLVMDTEMDERV